MSGRGTTGRDTGGRRRRDGRPWRVLYVDHTAKLAGGEIALLNLLGALPPGRVEPSVVLLEDGPLVGRLRGAGVPVEVLAGSDRLLSVRRGDVGPGAALRLGRLAIGTVARLAGRVRAGGYDAVHTNSLKADVLGGLAARAAGVPCVWHLHDRIADDYLPRRTVRAFRLACRWVPAGVVANSEATRRTLRLPPGKPCCVVYPGVPAGEVGRARATPAGTGGGPRVGLVGRIAAWKGQDVFLRAAARVRATHPSARFLVVGGPLFGEDDLDAALRRRAAEPDLAGAVEFTGFRDDVADLIAGLDVVVHASTVPEPFGQVVVEAMAAGRPVVAAGAGGVLETVADGETGLLVPPGDDAALAAAVASLLDDPDRRRRMGEAGVRRVRGHFTVERSAATLCDFYDRLFGRRAVRPISSESAASARSRTARERP